MTYRPRPAIAALALLAVLPLTACASSKPAAPAVDYGKAETSAATAFVNSDATFQGVRGAKGLEFVKAYCDSVAKEGVKATNRDDLLLYDSATVTAQQKAAGLYCPVTMRLAG